MDLSKKGRRESGKVLKDRAADDRELSRAHFYDLLEGVSRISTKGMQGPWRETHIPYRHVPSAKVPGVGKMGAGGPEEGERGALLRGGRQ